MLTQTFRASFRAFLQSCRLWWVLFLNMPCTVLWGLHTEAEGRGCGGLGDSEVTPSWSQTSVQSQKRTKYTWGVPHSLHSDTEAARWACVLTGSKVQHVCSTLMNMLKRLSSGGARNQGVLPVFGPSPAQKSPSTPRLRLRAAQEIM